MGLLPTKRSRRLKDYEPIKKKGIIMGYEWTKFDVLQRVEEDPHGLTPYLAARAMSGK